MGRLNSSHPPIGRLPQRRAADRALAINAPDFTLINRDEIVTNLENLYSSVQEFGELKAILYYVSESERTEYWYQY